MLTHQQAEIMINAASWSTADKRGRIRSHKFIAEAVRSFLAIMAEDVEHNERDEGNETPGFDLTSYTCTTIRTAGHFIAQFISEHGQHIGEASGDQFGSDLYLCAVGHGADFRDRVNTYGDADALADGCDLFTGWYVEAYANGNTIDVHYAIKRKEYSC